MTFWGSGAEMVGKGYFPVTLQHCEEEHWPADSKEHAAGCRVWRNRVGWRVTVRDNVDGAGGGRAGWKNTYMAIKPLYATKLLDPSVTLDSGTMLDYGSWRSGKREKEVFLLPLPTWPRPQTGPFLPGAVHHVTDTNNSLKEDYRAEL